ncbi:replication-associated recombination protein A [Parvularcula sp. LCG005]|nr:replication-associated recombination protein A [Parvularcula sp. LCG005]WOI54808.1 replication-associated recombination protein A [Parvularcula sp. LCG005]
MRPATVGEVVGQDHLLAEGAPLSRMLAKRRLSSIIFWGPPGVGKTTLARLLADEVDLDFVQISAIFTGVADLRKVFAQAEGNRAAGRGTLLFVDEIHRFNRAQQDSFLPVMESGVITLVGATTENPSFALNAALLSRAQVLTLNRLDADSLGQLVGRAETYLDRPLPLTPTARTALLELADGDGRFLLGLAEELAALPEDTAPLDEAALANVVQRRVPVYDANQDGHYNLISALHKAVRGSDTDAALYWFARMLEAGEDPRFLARRIIRMASEDIGLAAPDALAMTIAARDAYEQLGSPEGELALAQAVVYLASAPKSNGVYTAYKAARRAAKETGSLMPPRHAMNAPTKLMKAEGYSDGYVYDHDTPDGYAGLDYFPPGMERQNFYAPPARGAEKTIRDRLAWFAARRKPPGDRT